LYFVKERKMIIVIIELGFLAQEICFIGQALIESASRIVLGQEVK